MLFVPITTSNLLATGVVVLCLLSTSPARAESAATKRNVEQVEAHFRGCESAGWCRFWIESLDPLAQWLRRVRPDGVPRTPGDDATSAAVRNRMNALLSDMIHQAKHIVLQDLRGLDDGTFAATVTVNGIDLAQDPFFMELRAKAATTAR